MGCSTSRADGLAHEEALQHVIQMMRELKVKQIANIAARREGRRSREKYYGWAGVQGARAIAGGDAVLRRASIAHANWRRGGPVTVAIAPGTLLDLPADVTDTILDFLLEVSEKRDLSLGVQPRLDENIDAGDGAALAARELLDLGVGALTSPLVGVALAHIRFLRGRALGGLPRPSAGAGRIVARAPLRREDRRARSRNHRCVAQRICLDYSRSYKHFGFCAVYYSDGSNRRHAHVANCLFRSKSNLAIRNSVYP